MQNRILHILLLVLVTAFCSNCKTARSVSNNSNRVKWKNELTKPIGSHYIFHHEDANGKMGFSLNASTGCNTNYSGGSYESFNYFSDSILSKGHPSKYVNVGAQIHIGEIQIERNEHNAYVLDINNPNTPLLSSLFGTQVRFRTDGNDSLGYPAIDTTIYIPKKLNIRIQGVQRDSFNYNLADGVELFWDADTANKNGVYISVRADNYLHDDFNGSNPNNPVINSSQLIIIAEDDGHYKFKKSDFKNFPDKISIDMHVDRGNSVVVRKNVKTLLAGREMNFLHCVILHRK